MLDQGGSCELRFFFSPSGFYTLSLEMKLLLSKNPSKQMILRGRTYGRISPDLFSLFFRFFFICLLFLLVLQLLRFSVGDYLGTQASHAA